ncbi:Inositol-3-phosphate synthase [Phytophthora palmivora]|uniref:Inositol-3-phosphate synthase n=1 Tax=Phytophthora palmivora TaxID=4796 RepID=A0A2P4X908_9STRA|nr:Inositol-3-phosphate synthase [Phytophthora palmivora]
MYKWVAHYVKTCETCQRVKPSGHASAPLQSLPVPADCWMSMSLDFVFGLPADDKGNTSILVFVCRLSKMVHLAPTDGQTERVNRALQSICAEAPQSWSDKLSMVEFALNNAGGSRNSAVNALVELPSLTTKSVQILTKDLKGPRLASLSGSLTTRSKPKGCLDRVHVA